MIRQGLKAATAELVLNPQASFNWITNKAHDSLQIQSSPSDFSVFWGGEILHQPADESGVWDPVTKPSIEAIAYSWEKY